MCSTLCSPAGPVMEDWDIISPKDVIGSEQLLPERTRTLASAALPLTQSLLTQVQLLSLPIQSVVVRLNVCYMLCVCAFTGLLSDQIELDCHYTEYKLWDTELRFTSNQKSKTLA